MQIYRPHEQRHISSTDGSITVKDFSSSLYDTRWAIRIRGEWYITLQALSTVRAADMSGRATLVWRVVKKGTTEVSQTLAFSVVLTRPFTLVSTVVCLKADLATSYISSRSRVSREYRARFNGLRHRIIRGRLCGRYRR